MTSFKAPARSISNGHLLGLSIGNVLIPQLGRKVPWEGFGERAFLLITARRHPHIKAVIPQPFKMDLEVDGKRVRYIPDYLLVAPSVPPELLEIKGRKALLDERMERKLKAAETEAARFGYRFRVLESGALAHSLELRNVRLLRPYTFLAVRPVADAALAAALRAAGRLALSELVAIGLEQSISLQEVYSAIYRGVITFDWENELISDDSWLYPGRNA